MWILPMSKVGAASFNCVQKMRILPLSLAFLPPPHLLLQRRRDLFQIRRWQSRTRSETLQQRGSFFNSHHRFRHGIKERINPFVSLIALSLQRSWNITVLDWQNVHYKEDPSIRYTGEWPGPHYCGMCNGAAGGKQGCSIAFRYPSKNKERRVKCPQHTFNP